MRPSTRHRTLTALLFPILLLAAPNALGAAHPAAGGPPNVRVSGHGYADYGEPFVAVNQRAPRNLLAASQCFNGPSLPTPCTFASFDGGRTWRDNGPLPLPTGDLGGGDLTVAFDLSGHGFVASHAGAGWNVDTVVVWRTDDGGRTFARPVVVFPGSHGANVVDHPWLAADGDGALDIAWTVAPHGDLLRSQLLFSRSADGGRHFTRPQRIAQAAHGFPGIAVVTAGPGAIVHVFYATGGMRDPYARPFAPMKRMVIGSTDGGRHFGTPRLVAAEPGFGISLGNWSVANIQAAAVAPRDGTLYAAMVAYRPRGAHTEILLWRSTDGGASWAGPTRVDNEPGADGADHLQPRIAVTASGVVFVSYFALVRGRVTTFLAVSASRGNDFGSVGAVSTASFDPALSGQQREGGPWIGDYQGLAAGAGRVYALWNDTRSGQMAIYAAAIPAR